MKHFTLMLVFGLMVSFVPLAFGEETSKELTQEAAVVLAQGKAIEAIKKAEKCIKVFKAEAKKQQVKIKTLGKKALGGECKQVFEKYRLLNDVGMCQFIIGEAYRIQGKPKEANQAYKKLITEYPQSRTLLEVQTGNFILEKLANEAENRMKLDAKNKFYKLPMNIKIY